MWGVTPFDQLICRIDFKSMRYDGPFTPPSLQGSIVYPGNFGVFDWGGIAVDPVRQIAFVNPSYMAFKSTMIPASQIAAPRPARKSVKKPKAYSAEQRRAVRRGPRSAAVANGPAVPGASLGLRGSRLTSRPTSKTIWMHKNGTMRDSSPVPTPEAWAYQAWAAPSPPPVAWASSAVRLTSTCGLTTCARARSSGNTGCRRAVKRRP